MRMASRIAVAGVMPRTYRKSATLLENAVYCIHTSKRIFHSSHGAASYLERLYDIDVKEFLDRLRTCVFESDADFRPMFNNFQRYLRHFRSSEIVEIVEMIHSRNVRENDEGFDLMMLLICEMNERLINSNKTYFSLKQTHRICSVLKHVKFNRPSYLIDTAHHAMASDSSPYDMGFRVASSFNWDTECSTTEKQQRIMDSTKESSQAECTERTSNAANVNIVNEAECCKHNQMRYQSASCSQSPNMYTKMPQAMGEHRKHTETDAECPEYHHLLFPQNYREVLVPVCECNVGAISSYYSCQKCCNRYGKLLQISGQDHLALLIVLLGRSIVIQSRAIRKRHENAVTSYLTLSSHFSCTMNSHILGTIMANYLAAFATSKSIRNIAIGLQAAKKCKVRCGVFKKKVIARLADLAEFESLCADERNMSTLLIAFNQIVSGIICTNKLPISQNIKNIGINIVTYLVDNYERIFCNSIDQDTLKSAKGSAKLLVDYLTEKGVDFSRILLDDDIEKLDAILADGKVEYFKDFKTSDLHKQVASVLSMLGVNYEEEVYINPHFCDVFLRKSNLVLEIDGPYHFCTGINHR